MCTYKKTLVGIIVLLFVAIGTACSPANNTISTSAANLIPPVSSEAVSSSRLTTESSTTATGSSSTPKQNPSYKTEGLEEWVGDYFFQTVIGDHFYYRYEITIRSENGGYFADLAVDGWQMGYREKAKVEGNRDSIELTLIEHLVPAALGELELDSKLLSFEKIGQELHTKWLELPSPYWGENAIPEITFIKENAVPSWFYDLGVENSLLYTSISPSGWFVAHVYSSTNPVSGETYYLLTVLPQNEEFRLQPANAYAAPKEFKIEWTDYNSNRGGWEKIDSLDVHVMGCKVPEWYKSRHFVRNVQLSFSD